MKYLLVLFIFVASIASAENLLWNKATGKIIGHTAKKVEVTEDSVSCGAKIKKVNWAKVGIGSVAVWVEGAKNISELGPITPIDPEDEAANLDEVDKLLKAIVLVFADETGNTPAQIKQKILTKYKSLP